MILQIAAFFALLQAQFDIRSTPWSCILLRFPHCYKRDLIFVIPHGPADQRVFRIATSAMLYSQYRYSMILHIVAFSALLQAYCMCILTILWRYWLRESGHVPILLTASGVQINNYCMESGLRKMAELSHYRQQACKWIKDSSPQAPPKIAPIETSEVSRERVPGMEAGVGGSLRNRSVAYGSSQDMYVPYVLCV